MLMFCIDIYIHYRRGNKYFFSLIFRHSNRRSYFQQPYSLVHFKLKSGARLNLNNLSDDLKKKFMYPHYTHNEITEAYNLYDRLEIQHWC